MKIKLVTTSKEENDLDQLLWEVLWKPLDLPRDIRKSFELPEPQIELIALDKGSVIGGLVANWLSENEMEIRHIAIKLTHIGKSVGKSLVEELLKHIQGKESITIHTHARNTSIGFFAGLGFTPRGNRLDYDKFMKYGIWIQQMYIEM